MNELAQMSEDELNEAVRRIIETASNISSHGERDDYVVGMWRMAHRYQAELERRRTKEGNSVQSWSND